MLFHIPLSIVLLILAIQFIVGKRKVIEGKRTMYDLFMVLFLLFTGIGTAYGVLADTVLQDYETETVTVKAVRTPRLRGLIEKEVHSIDGQVYDNPFNEFTITFGKTYEITYLARTRIIIDVEEVEVDESLSDFKRTEIFYNPETNEKMYYDTNTYKIYTAEDYKAIFDENVPKLDAPSDKPKGMGLKRLIPRKFSKDEMTINPTDSRKDYGKTWSERHAEHKANLLKNTAIDMSVEENIAVEHDSVTLDYDVGDDLGF